VAVCHFLNSNKSVANIELDEDKDAAGAKAELYLIWSKALYPMIRWTKEPVYRDDMKGDEGRRWSCTVYASNNKGKTW